MVLVSAQVLTRASCCFLSWWKTEREVGLAEEIAGKPGCFVTTTLLRNALLLLSDLITSSTKAIKFQHELGRGLATLKP
jgi:hypothetical protein